MDKKSNLKMKVKEIIQIYTNFLSNQRVIHKLWLFSCIKQDKIIPQMLQIFTKIHHGKHRLEMHSSPSSKRAFAHRKISEITIVFSL